jgi:Fe-Mn family superoxide dismutase
MAFTLPDLPYSKDALEPYISARTLEFHHDKHHAKYVSNLNDLIQGTELVEESLKEIIVRTTHDSSRTGIFNNGSQAFNHEFFWNCMKPGGGGEPTGELAHRIEGEYGDYSAFREKFSSAAEKLFGSGWVWLMMDEDKLEILQGGNADSPVAHGKRPLLTLDVWEHAYYLDYQNARPKFIAAFLDHLVNWDFVAQNFQEAWEPTA